MQAITLLTMNILYYSSCVIQSYSTIFEGYILHSREMSALKVIFVDLGLAALMWPSCSSFSGVDHI